MPAEFEVYADNWEVVSVFMRMQTQWRISPMGQRSGLVYSSLDTVLAGMEIKFTPDLFTDLQVMEIALINESNSDGNDG